MVAEANSRDPRTQAVETVQRHARGHLARQLAGAKMAEELLQLEAQNAVAAEPEPAAAAIEVSAAAPAPSSQLGAPAVANGAQAPLSVVEVPAVAAPGKLPALKLQKAPASAVTPAATVTAPEAAGAT